MTIGKRLDLRLRPPSTTGSGARGVERKPAAPHGGRARLDVGAFVLGTLILLFAWSNFQLWLRHPGVLVGLGQVLLELLQGALFFIRRRDAGGRRPPAVWLASIVGSWGFLLARPIGGGYFASTLLFGTQPLFGAGGLWQGVQLTGTALAILSLSSLGRSFGLLAANRGIRTEGPYRVVRHPAYASYFIVQSAYVLENFSVWNLAIFGVVAAAQLARIRQEEAVLAQDAAYQRYRREVRYRLLPGIY